ncbi:MAG: exonuclease SbcCD subunit D [Anaerolineae bacterium]|nr:exonuclease SbcCD subunit D [Anaerolineae bacterium]
MTDPIRVLHFADIHVGMENYGRFDPETGYSSRVRDFLHRLDEIIAYGAEHDVDLIIFAGDAFKTRAPNPTYQRELAHRVRDLSNLAPVVMLVGNHDMSPNQLKASSIEIYDTLAVPNVWVADAYETRVIQTKRGDVLVGTAPYPIRSRIIDDERTRGLTIAEIDARLQSELAQILETLAEEANAYDLPRLLTGHFTISGAIFGSERGIMLGRDIQVLPSAVADPRWDYVALGHIHKHQNLTHGREDVPPVVYSGSLERIDFGEEGDPKGFCWVELARGATQWQFVPVNSRPFVTLEADLRESQDPTAETVDLIEEYALEEAIVRLILKMTPESEARFNEGIVRDALRRARVSAVAAIRKEVDQPARARLGDNPEGLTDLELLERYMISKQIDGDRRAQLLSEAENIIDSVQARLADAGS